MKVTKFFSTFALVVLFCVPTASADTIIDLVTVLNVGNTGELSGSSIPGGSGEDRICGAVDHVYRIGKYEISAGQYTAFLNAVAKNDVYGLYTVAMWSDSMGCKIERHSDSGNYAYTVEDDWANRPVNFVRWSDAARFCNWMHNGQPTGTLTGNPAQDAWLTEDGSYFLNGALGSTQLYTVTREPDATWVIPNEDEWYKAAYHKNDGPTGNYWHYPTRTNEFPNNGNPEGDTGNSATFYDGDYTSPTYFRTAVGYFSQSHSPYGTCDQGGNVSEWNEGKPSAYERGVRGGGFDWYSYQMLASTRDHLLATERNCALGFRVAYVPEPATLAMLAFGLLVVLHRR